jgi:hypothetical protein
MEYSDDIISSVATTDTDGREGVNQRDIQLKKLNA